MLPLEVNTLEVNLYASHLQNSCAFSIVKLPSIANRRQRDEQQRTFMEDNNPPPTSIIIQNKHQPCQR